MKFSIIVVCLNAGEKLDSTLQSILSQSYENFEIIVKDGGSRDGSLERLPKDDRIRLFVERDTGIYDAMNQAVAHAKGEFLIFMNCGDHFHEKDSLSKVFGYLSKEPRREGLLLYGKIFNEKQNSFITPSPQITGFTCYRNVPCHQSCVYEASLCKKKAYNGAYRIRADYEHFLWCFYRGDAKMVYMDMVLADYEGGGFSETAENIRLSKEEHRQITAIYMKKAERMRYRMILLITLAPLRRFLAENPRFSKIYHRLVDSFYHTEK